MKTLASAALAATLLAGPALADAPAPPPSTAAPMTGGRAKPAAEKDGVRKPDAKPAQKAAAKPGTEAKKDAPCEPVKPCPIE